MTPIASATGLGPQPGDHRLRQLDAVDRNAPGGQRKGDPSGPDPELERAPVPGQLRKEVHRGFDDGRIEHLVEGFVVVLGDLFAEVPVVFVHRLNLAGKFT